MSFTGAIKSRWNNYWFSRDLLFSASVLRIFVSLSVLIILIKSDYGDYSNLLRPDRASLYQPIGILQLLGQKIPSPTLFNIIRIIAFASTFMVMIGAFTRITKVLSLLSSLMIISILFSWGGEWSHGENIPLLMHIALVFAPSQVYFSIDSLIFKKRPQSWFMQVKNNGWSVYLAMIAAVIMFFNAGYYKFMVSPKFDWVFSDNLRNYLIQEYLVIYRKPIPTYLEWIVNNEIGYKGLAMLNMISQLGIIVVIFFTKRPYVRLFFGLVFFMEALGLYVVMGYENQAWLPLSAAFIDWEYFRNKFRRKNEEDVNHSKTSYSGKYKSTATIVLSIYLGVFIITAFDRGAGWQTNLKPYPFSAFAMFSPILCKTPFDKHLPVEYYGNEFEFEVDAPDKVYNDSLSNALSYQYYNHNFIELSNPGQIHDIVNHPNVIFQKVKHKRVHSIRWYRCINQSPAYPQKASLNTLFKGLIGKINQTGTFKSIVSNGLTINGHDVELELDSAGYLGYDVIKVQGIFDSKIGPMDLDYSVNANVVHIKDVPKGDFIFLVTIFDKEDKVNDTYLIGKGHK